MRSVLWLVLVAGCASDEVSTTDSGGEDTEEGLIGEGVPWPEKTAEEKHSWMTYRVKPRMVELFTEFDPAYADILDCGTCHGPDTLVSDYGTMPHPNGPATLSFADWPSDSTDPTTQAYATFMEDVVQPEFAALIDSEVSFPSGVSCSTCHQVN
jgi:hypothetical protein